MSAIRITNYATGLRPNPGEEEIYVGRSRWVGTSPLGNPFTVEEHGREAAIGLYREWLIGRLADPGSEQSVALEAIRQAVARGPVALRCHCAPEPCHADVIKAFLRERGATCAMKPERDGLRAGDLPVNHSPKR